MLTNIDTLKFDEKPKTKKRSHADTEIEGTNTPVHDLYQERRMNKKPNMTQSS